MNTPQPEETVSKLSDENILRNYCTFAGFYRAHVVATCFQSLRAETDKNRQRFLTIEILGSYVNILEDLA